MSKDELMIAQLREVFPTRPVDSCADFDDREKFYIYEDTVSNRSYILRDESDAPDDGFLIVNPKQKNIHLLSVDNCFFTAKDSYKKKRCDGIAFDDHYFCFVELKLNVHKRKQAARQLREARQQLGEVIEFFKESFDNDFLGLELEAFAAMRQNIYPRSRASRNSVYVNFLEMYGVKLFEKNAKEF